MHVSVLAQTSPFWGGLRKGEYAVGHRWEVLHKNDEVYTFGDYSGGKPFFLSVWYPAIDDESVVQLRLRDYFLYPAKTVTQRFVDTLAERHQRIFIRDAICSNAKGHDRSEFDPLRQELAEKILSTPVGAKANLREAGNNFPIIVYHHGANSYPEDNTVFCEYMASHGFIVMSSNYHWPFGTDRLRTDSNNDIQFVLNSFLGQPQKSSVYAVGHSWGAQAFFFHDRLPQKYFRKIISLDSTLEPFDSTLLRKYWPQQYWEFFEFNNDQMTTPTYLFANNHDERGAPQFQLFRKNKVTPYLFVTLKSMITHDGFISLGNYKFPYSKNSNLPGHSELIEQQHYFEHLAEIILDILREGNDENNLFDKYKEVFLFETLNK
jgi:hypothetical protein